MSTRLEPLPLALPPPRNRCACSVPPPLDRPIWLRANIAYKDGCFTEVDQWEGRAEWDQQKQEWMTDHKRLAIRNDYDAELIVLEWEELDDRARNAPENETDVRANIYCWDSIHRREDGTAGFYALVGITHSPTCVRLIDETEGPFATQGEAFTALLAMLTRHSPLATPHSP